MRSARLWPAAPSSGSTSSVRQGSRRRAPCRRSGISSGPERSRTTPGSPCGPSAASGLPGRNDGRGGSPETVRTPSLRRRDAGLRPAGSSPERRTHVRSPSSCSSGKAWSRATACGPKECRAAMAPSIRSSGSSRPSVSAAVATSWRAWEELSSRSRAQSSGSGIRAPERTHSSSPRPTRLSRMAGPCHGRGVPARARPAWPAPTSSCSQAKPALFVERGGRTIVPLRDPEEDWLRDALAALVDHARQDRAEAARGRALRRPSRGRDRGHAAARRGGVSRRSAARRSQSLSRAERRVSGDMPEGDSLHRAADRMRVLEGQVVSVETPHPRAALLGLADRLDGKRLERVEAVGKNLLLTFEGGLVLRSHLRMKGRWHVRRAEEKLIGRPWLVLRGDEWKAVQWNGPVLELGSRTPVPIRAARPGHHGRAARCGRDGRAAAGDRAGPRDRGGDPRSAARRGDREHVEGRGPLAGGAFPMDAASLALGRRAPRPPRGCGRSDAGSSGRAGDLPPGGAALPAVWRADPRPAPG